MDFAVIDPRTAKVAIQLQLEDIAEILRTIDKSMGQGAIDGVANLDRIQHDLVQQLMELESQILVISILRTEHQERVTIENLLNEEKQIAGDHELAMGLAGLSLSGADTASRPLDTPYNDEDDAQWEMAKQLYTSAFDQDNIDSAPEENSVQHIVADRSPYQGLRTIAADEARKTLSSEVLAKCNACFEPWPVKDTIHLHCMHIYCRTCLLDLFTSAILNPTLFPPRCCRQPIPLETCRAMLPKELIKDFDLKVEELATPNPTYCANADCSKFIRPKEIVDDIGSCVFCEHKTCIQCKNKSHDGLCPNDPHVQLLMDVAKRSKWQVCNNCNNMVELETGCFHMTCRCKHEFCYLCGTHWKRCSCPQWDEQYLTRPTVAQPPVARPVQAPAHHVHDWARQPRATCQGCGANYLPWVMHCSGCNSASCWRCIHNRD